MFRCFLRPAGRARRETKREATQTFVSTHWKKDLVAERLKVPASVGSRDDAYLGPCGIQEKFLSFPRGTINPRPARRTQCSYGTRSPKCVAFRSLQIVCGPSGFPSQRQGPPTWEDAPLGVWDSVRIFPETKTSFPETHGNFPENRLCSNSFRPGLSRKFPGNFFRFPGKKKVFHQKNLSCFTGKFEKPPGGRYKPFREYWPRGTLPRPDFRYTDFLDRLDPPTRPRLKRLLHRIVSQMHTKRLNSSAILGCSKS